MILDGSESSYDSSRPTIGRMYRDLQMKSGRDPVLVGDMANEMIKGALHDLNEALMTDPYDGHPFYVMIHEKKDLQMKSAILRRIIKLSFRPWPEDDTVVFWKDPKTQEVCFCWALPHWSEMDNILVNAHFFSSALIDQIIAWKAFDLEKFGFMRQGDAWTPNPLHRDQRVA